MLRIIKTKKENEVKLRLIFIMAILGLITLFCHAQMRSITHTTTGTNDLSITIETNTRYVIHSMGVSFTNGSATGFVGLIHTRENNPIVLKLVSLSNNNSFVAYFASPYVVDGKQGDTLELTTTNTAKPSKTFLTIEYQ